MSTPSVPRSNRLVRPPAVGDTVGRYRIVGELGRGGMGVVYRAEDPQLDRAVALKVLPSHLQRDTRAKERLMVEARAAAALDHPNVCTVYEVAEEPDGRAFIALACYEGQTLRERLQDGPLPLDEAVRIAREVAAGLATAHDRGIVHRDLKPSNVFLCTDGTAKILDFGIAKLPGIALTTEGSTPGTIEYGAPETTRGQVDARSDVWSMGVVLFEMLTGRRPFDAPYEAALLYAVLHEDPPSASSLAPSVPPELDAIVARCLEKDSGARYPDAAALALELAPEEARQPDDVAVSLRRAGRGALRRLKRSRVWQAGLVAALVGLVAVGIGMSRATDASALPSEMLVAVLPLEPRPDAPEDSAFAIGLAEELASGLVQRSRDAGNLSVIPYTEIHEEEVRTAREASVELGANLVVEGRIVREADQVRVVLQLVRPGRRSRVIDVQEVWQGETDDGSLRAVALQALVELLRLGGGESDAALADLAGAETADPEAEKHYLRGLGYFREDQKAGHVDAAITEFSLAVEIDTAYTAAFARLGEAYAEKWRTTLDSSYIGKAEIATEQAHQLDPENPITHLARAILFTRTGQTRQAVSAANAAVRAAPNSYDALIVLGGAEQANGDFEGAKRAFRQAIRLSPQRWKAHAMLGYAHYFQSQPDSAAATFKRILNIAPNNFQALYTLAVLAQEDENPEAAIDYYTRASSVREHHGTYTGLAGLLVDNGDPQSAVEYGLKALAINEADHQTWANLASAYDEMPEHREEWGSALDRAIELANDELAVNPNDASVLSAGATYYALRGNDVRARELADRAVSQAPESVRTRFNIGYAYAAVGDVEAALPHITASLKAGYGLKIVQESDIFVDIRHEEKMVELIDMSSKSR